MCGRLACGLNPQDLCNACCYKDTMEGNYRTPQWRDCHNSGKTYKPSYNICPTEVAPVLLSGSHFKSSSRILVPMLFGVIPHWAEATSSKYSTINCRIETICSSKLYGNLLKRNQRCVVICNGFFEWQKQPTKKKPYFIHSKQPNEVKVDDPKTWNLEFTPERGYSGFKPLKLAALFEVDSHKSMEQATFSFTVITKEANEDTSWLHARIPAIIETEEQMDAWLNYEEVDTDLALSYISCKNGQILCIPVCSFVNQVTNKDISCIKENEEQENNSRKRSPASLLKEWLEKGSKKPKKEVKK